MERERERKNGVAMVLYDNNRGRQHKRIFGYHSWLHMKEKRGRGHNPSFLDWF